MSKMTGLSMMAWTIVAVLAAAAALVGTSAIKQEVAGAKVTLTQGGLDFAKQAGLAALQKQFNEVPVPDLKGSDPVPNLGIVDWTVTKITLSSLSLTNASSRVATQPDTGAIALTITNAYMVANMTFGFYQESAPHASGSGELLLSVNGTSVQALMKLAENQQLQPTLSTLSTTCNVSSVNIIDAFVPRHTHCLSCQPWVYEGFFQKVLSGVIQTAVEQAVGPAVATILANTANEALHSIAVSQDLWGTWRLNLSCPAPPTVGKDYIAVSPRADVSLLPNGTEVLPFRFELPDVVNEDMLQITISDTVPTSAFGLLFTANKLQMAIQQKDIPYWLPIELNTNFWEPLLPGLANWPNTPMEVQLGLTQGPSISVQPDRIMASLVGQLVVALVYPNINATQGMLAFGLTGLAIGQAQVSNGRLTAKFTSIDCQYKMIYDEIGGISIDKYVWVMQSLCTDGLMPYLNTQLDGIPIPTIPGVNYANLRLTPGMDYMTFSANLTFANPPHSHKLRLVD